MPIPVPAIGSKKIVTILGTSIGGVVRDYETKEVVTGSYRHTVGDVAFKCAQAKLAGAVVVEYGEYEGRGFWSLRSLLTSAAEVQASVALRDSLADIDLSAF
jgi:plastocyanin domain-containing protein